jgi:hypothetical protein
VVIVIQGGGKSGETREEERKYVVIPLFFKGYIPRSPSLKP